MLSFLWTLTSTVIYVLTGIRPFEHGLPDAHGEGFGVALYTRQGRVLREKSGRPAPLDVIRVVEFIGNRRNTAPEDRILDSNIGAGCDYGRKECHATTAKKMYPL